MKLLWCYVAAFMIAASNGAVVNVEKTVQQVQSILKANTLLPRLTREEILQLLNDIRAEDAKSTSLSVETSKEVIKTTPAYDNDQENEINPVTQSSNLNKDVDIKDNTISESIENNKVESTTKHSGPTLTVVLPYTPRDGSSLQELYTRPPRVEVVPEPKTTPKPKKASSSGKLEESLKKNAELAKKKQMDFTAELQAFLDAHGLKGKPGQDNFLLPLEGFKPLPPPQVVDGTVQLPENILLTYDLIAPPSSADDKHATTKVKNNFLYEPLRPEYPFELDTSSSDTQESVLPFDLPKPRKTKSAEPAKPNYEPIDYDSVKVIPLNKGPNPVEDDKIILESEQSKRQTNDTESLDKESVNETTSDSKDATSAPDVVAADTDTGASIADLEDSFGGAAPAEPGDSVLPPPRKNGFYWMLDWNSFLEVGDGDTKVNIRFEPKLGDPQMFLPVSVP